MRRALSPTMEKVLRQIGRAHAREGDLLGEMLLLRLPAHTARALLRRGLIEPVPSRQQAFAYLTQSYEPNQYVRLTENGQRRIKLMRLGHRHPEKP